MDSCYNVFNLVAKLNCEQIDLATKVNTQYAEERKLSSESLEKREALLEEFVREIRQFNGLGASFFRAAAARIGMNVTDLQVTDILDITGPTTAGRLAELMGLTTGAITGMIDRLEKAGLVRRERDVNDGRRVIVRLIADQDALRETGPIFDSIGRGWDQIASDYDDEQLAFLLEFLKRSNAVSRREISRLREAPEDEGRAFSAPLGKAESGRLVFFSAMSRLVLRGDARMEDLYRADFEGSLPNIKVEEGNVTIRYPQRMWLVDRGQRMADVRLNTVIPWRIVIHGGASEITAELGGLDLAELEVKGGMSMIRLELPKPSGVVPIQISGGASEIMVRHPVGVAVRAHLKGWVSEFIFGDQTFSAMGNDMRLQSPGYTATGPCYDIEVASSASMVTITSG